MLCSCFRNEMIKIFIIIINNNGNIFAIFYEHQERHNASYAVINYAQYIFLAENVAPV